VGEVLERSSRKHILPAMKPRKFLGVISAGAAGDDFENAPPISRLAMNARVYSSLTRESFVSTASEE
jgi:hypothetical protein